MFRQTLVLRKSALRALRDDKIKSQMDFIRDRALGGGRGARGWACTYAISSEPEIDVASGAKFYVAGVTVSHSANRNIDAEIEAIIRTVIPLAARGSAWEIERAPGERQLIRLEESGFSEDLPVVIPDDWESYFAHLYDREEQIGILMSALEAAIDSNFANRFHVVGYGEPACGKTALGEALAKMLGEDLVYTFDATSTSSAGAIKHLTSAPILPKVIIVEEIEKCDESALRWLLGVLDHRAEIRKLTARDQIQRDVRLLCYATINNFELFSRMLSGALASRFAHRVYCPRPSADILARILKREIERLENGRMEWIAPTIAYAAKHDLNDPRKLISICLCGKDRLLDGSYQRMLEKCQPSVAPC